MENLYINKNEPVPFHFECHMSKERIDHLIATTRFFNILRRIGISPKGSSDDLKVQRELDEARREMEIADAIEEASDKTRFKQYGL